MPDVGFEDHLDDEGLEWLRVRFTNINGQVTWFSLQFETTLDGKRVPVVRYDCAHGSAHRDRMDRRGQQVDKEWLEWSSLAEAMTRGQSDIKANWRTYRRAFHEDEA